MLGPLINPTSTLMGLACQLLISWHAAAS